MVSLQHTTNVNTASGGFPIAASRAELIDEYCKEHEYPWIVGFSGGKDSTLVAHLVLDMLLELPPSERRRSVHFVSNDTLVESPLVMRHVKDTMSQILTLANNFCLPIFTKITQPPPDQTFWVNIIGRGYPSPNRTFRWCTSRMKISPTSQYIRSQVDNSGKVTLLLGVRRFESSARSSTINKHDNGERLHPHSDLQNCMVFRPIVDVPTDDLWEFLSLNDPPWGGAHLQLIHLYREASGGECPIITAIDDIPSCGNSSSRFGCWTCTVVEKDRSLEGLVDSGYVEFRPLIDFRNWLVSIRNEKSRRLAKRRNGKVTITESGKYVPGPFTLDTRFEILDRLHKLEEEMEMSLISTEEVSIIHKIWTDEINFNCSKLSAKTSS